MQSKPKVSVIAGIYFPPEICFRRFLDACLNQTMSDIEFIFILDGPNDVMSRNILMEYNSLFKNNKNTFIIIENEKNLDVVPTYLKGCNLAKSECLLIVDSDDFFDNDWIFQMYNYFITNNLDFLGPNIIIGYIGKLDIFYALNDNTNPDDTGIMFKKELLKKYTLFKEHLNYLSVRTMLTSKYKGSVLPLSLSSFYFYTVSERSATCSFILDKNEEMPKSKESEFYKRIVIADIEEALGKAMQKSINFKDYSLEELKQLAIKYLDLDNLLENILSYKDLSRI